MPGIETARAVHGRKKHLDTMAYLKGPKVFGFHGVYKRLAIALGIVDSNLGLAENGDRLLRTWEREQELPGFADDLKQLVEGQFLRNLQKEVLRTLEKARVVTSLGSHLWGRLVKSLRPDRVGKREGKLVFRLLTSPTEPFRKETMRFLDQNESDGDEWATLRRFEMSASPELQLRLAPSIPTKASQRGCRCFLTGSGRCRLGQEAEQSTRPCSIPMTLSAHWQVKCPRLGKSPASDSRHSSAALSSKGALTGSAKN